MRFLLAQAGLRPERFGKAASRLRGGASGPVSDPIIQSINANGWSVTTTSNPPSMTPDSAPRFLYGFEPGFSANGSVTSVAVTHILTSRIRQSYPNNATLTADQVALSDYAFQDGTYLGVSNGSAERSPKPVANWSLPPNRIVGNTLRLEFTVFHRSARGNSQIACAEFRATDGVNTVTQRVSFGSVLNDPSDQFAVIGYACNLDITSLTPGQITANASAKPHIGHAGSILDSADQSDSREFSPQVFLKNVALAANPVLVYVNVSTGNDATGAVSTTAATAEAAPCASMGGAINRAIAVNGSLDGVEIRFMAGTHVLSTSAIIATRAQSAGWCTFARDPNAARSAVILQHGSTSARMRFGAAGGYLKISGVSLQRTGAQAFTGEAASSLRVWFDGVTYDAGGFNNSLYSNANGYWTGGEFSNMPANSTSILGAGSASSNRLIRGCSGDLNGAAVELWNVIGCNFTRPLTLTAGTARSPSGSIVAFNRFTAPTSNTLITMGIQSDINGAAIVQNLIENTGAGSAHVMGIANDNGVGNATHVILHNNTLVGAFEAGRCNILYDEGPTARTSKLMSVVGNIFVAIFTKSDVFRGGNQAGADASTRTGNWAFMYGVGCRANFTMHQSNTPLGGNEAQAYGGLRSKIGTSQIIRQDPLFTDYKATTVAVGPVYTAGAGGGTYSLLAGSPAIGMNDNGVLPFDLAGTARSATASAAGAYERLAA